MIASKSFHKNILGDPPRMSGHFGHWSDGLVNVSHILDLKRLPSKGKGPDGKWTRKPLVYREFKQFSSMCYPLLKYLSTLFLNIFTLLVFTQPVGDVFHSLIVLCKNEYFLITNLHCSLLILLRVL